MASKQSTVDYFFDQAASLHNLHARKMFGEYAVYCGEKVVGLICDDQIYIKPTESGKELINGRYEDAPPYPGAKPFLLIGDDVLEDRELLCRLITQTAAALPLPKPKKIKKLSGKVNTKHDQDI